MSELIVTFVVGLVSGLMIATMIVHFATKKAEAQIESAVNELVDSIKQSTISVRVEEHAGMYYVYNTADDSFMAQGTTLKEIREVIESRWKEYRVFVTEGDESVINALKETSTNA